MSVEAAARAEVAGLPEAVRCSTLAATALDLAIRLDGEPTDRDAAALSRELRLVWAELHQRVGGAGGEGEEIVARIRTASLGD